jgi:hypothetical protein
MSWQSSSLVPTSNLTSSDAIEIHNEVCSNARTHIVFGFESIHRALQELETQILEKIENIHTTQQEILINTKSPSPDAIADLQRNASIINRSVELFSSKASTLHHIKLTLARCASLVSPQGNLNNLISRAQPISSFDLQTSKSLRLERSLDLNDSSTFSGYKLYPITECKDDSSLYRDSYYNSQLEDRLVRIDNRHSLLEYTGKNIERPHPVSNSTCFVFYLPKSVTSETLKNLFSPYGTILNVYIAIDKITNKNKGFAFVDMAHPQEAISAVKALDRYPLGGKFLSVSIKV